MRRLCLAEHCGAPHSHARTHACSPEPGLTRSHALVWHRYELRRAVGYQSITSFNAQDSGQREHTRKMVSAAGGPAAMYTLHHRDPEGNARFQTTSVHAGVPHDPSMLLCVQHSHAHFRRITPHARRRTCLPPPPSTRVVRSPHTWYYVPVYVRVCTAVRVSELQR